jgi:hypothetical protein
LTNSNSNINEEFSDQLHFENKAKKKETKLSCIDKAKGKEKNY